MEFQIDPDVVILTLSWTIVVTKIMLHLLLKHLLLT